MSTIDSIYIWKILDDLHCELADLEVADAQYHRGYCDGLNDVASRFYEVVADVTAERIIEFEFDDEDD